MAIRAVQASVAAGLLHHAHSPVVVIHEDDVAGGADLGQVAGVSMAEVAGAAEGEVDPQTGERASPFLRNLVVMDRDVHR
mgnify:CR=1 FL=1